MQPSVSWASTNKYGGGCQIPVAGRPGDSCFFLEDPHMRGVGVAPAGPTRGWPGSVAAASRRWWAACWNAARRWPRRRRWRRTTTSPSSSSSRTTPVWRTEAEGGGVRVIAAEVSAFNDSKPFWWPLRERGWFCLLSAVYAGRFPSINPPPIKPPRPRNEIPPKSPSSGFSTNHQKRRIIFWQ